MATKIDSFYKKTGIGSYCDGARIEGECLFTQVEIKKLQQGFDDIFKLASKSKMRVSVHPNCDDLSAYYSGRFPARCSTCSFPNYSLNIDETGQVYSCLGYRLGSLVENSSIKEIWGSRRTRDFQKRIMEKIPVPGCYRCCALSYRFTQ